MCAHVIVRYRTEKPNPARGKLQVRIEPLTPFRVLAHNTVNQVQIVVSAMEQHEPKMALNACKKIKDIADEMRLEILGIKQQVM